MMNHAFSRVLLLAMIGAAGAACGGAQGAAAESPGENQAGAEGGGMKVDAAMARESQGLSPRKVAGQGVSAEVLSSADPRVVVEEGGTKVVIPIGAQADVQCIVYEQEPDPGGTFVAILQNIGKEFELRQVTPGPLQVAKEAPVTSLDVLYAAPSAQGPVLGELKLAFHNRFGGSSLCLHDEVGYRKTFAQAAQSFFETLDRGKPGLAPAYVEVHAGEINDVPAGHDRNLEFVEKGKRKLLSTSLLLIQPSPVELLAKDSSSIISVDEKDRIESGRWLESDNGVLALDVQLERVKGNRYRYQGVRRGQAVKGELTSKDPLGLPSSVWTQKELKTKLAKPAAFALSFEQYRPNDDPATLTLMEIARHDGDPARAVRLKVKDLEARSTIDEQGRDQRSEFQVGGAKIVLERAYQRGQ